eukprot:TRINITY_DN79422_c0_g1_i1.p1 TRINITY_DN79422_c0_g1~~TRINITY_DN79422_c0_g1_i1.p1  ORF type:complete len:243 (-),score=8.17 TRINITY_DN79422_c0_g1_i1:138-866(-)
MTSAMTSAFRRPSSTASSTVVLVAVIVAVSSGFVKPAIALQGCGGSCASDNDCSGQLACISGRCADDPGVGTHICKTAKKCKPKGYIKAPIRNPYCNNARMSDCCKPGRRYPKYTCSPPVSSATSAILTLNGFGKAQDGGGPSECDGKYHANTEQVVAVSTGWYASGSRCGKQILITAPNGKSTTATVVDECDSRAGCDKAHAGQPPCMINDVDASAAVWAALGISPSNDLYGFMNVKWKDV